MKGEEVTLVALPVGITTAIIGRPIGAHGMPRVSPKRRRPGASVGDRLAAAAGTFPARGGAASSGARARIAGVITTAAARAV